MTTLQADRLLECEGLACPLPVVRTKKTMDEMDAGEVLEVRATDQGSVADLRSWSGRAGHEYIGVKEENGVFRHFIRKAEAADTKAERNYPHIASNEEVYEEIASGKEIRILDVREPAEYAFGHIPGAVSIPLGQLEARMSELDPGQAYYLVCRTGVRSDLACRILSDQGFQHIKNVIPGMSEWTYAQEHGEH